MRISDWSSDVCSSDLGEIADALTQHHTANLVAVVAQPLRVGAVDPHGGHRVGAGSGFQHIEGQHTALGPDGNGAARCLGKQVMAPVDRKSTRLTSSH